MNNYINMKCSQCGATMQVDPDKMIKFCPYCGCADLIEESDDVKKARFEKDIRIHESDKAAEVEKHRIDKQTLPEILDSLTLPMLIIMGIFMMCFAGCVACIEG